MAGQVKSRAIVAAACRPRVASRSAPSASALRKAVGYSLHGTHQPVPSSRNRLQGVESVTTTGTPAAIASAIASPKFSLWLGNRNMFATA